MALTNLTFMLLLTSLIDKSNLLSISNGQNKEDIYLNNNKNLTLSTEKSTKAVHIWTEDTLIENHTKDASIDHIVDILEQQYRFPKFATIPTNDPNDQVEDVQSDDDVIESDIMLEEQFRHPKFVLQMQNEIFDEDIEVHSKELNESHLLTIFACLLAVLLVGSILAIISWRSYIKQQYGMRHRLVSSDEFEDDDRVHL